MKAPALILQRAALCFYTALFTYAVIYGLGIWLPDLSRAEDARVPSATRGEYLARAGDCFFCHTAAADAPVHVRGAGGLPIHTPIGTLYSTNITPDKTYGIGNYTLEEFSRALREGVAKDGHHLYPAMPYPAFSGMTDADIADLYEYFMHGVKPVAYRPQPTKLAFPFNQRWGIWFWDKAFAKRDSYQGWQNDKDASWNRGAYLVLTLGHCSACHTPRGPAFEPRGGPGSRIFMSGGVADSWYAANLSSSQVTGLGSWSEKDILSFLKTGHNENEAAFGGMKDVVENSTQYLTDEDASAIAHYLKTLLPYSEYSSYRPSQGKQAMMFELPGAGIYAAYCSRCHQPEGTGIAQRYPALAGNPLVRSADPLSITRLVLQGGKTVQINAGPAPKNMPAFASLTDLEVAQVINYIRQSWGNNAPAITAQYVSKTRQTIKESAQ